MVNLQKIQEASSSRQEEPSDIPQAPTFPELLERAGFRIRGRRADCPKCEGRSRLTVSFTTQVAYCHRCHWTGNYRTVARGLGLALPPERAEDRAVREGATQFAAWSNTCYLLIVRRLRDLTARAEMAKKVLSHFPDCQPAWSALADLYHSEASLLGALDVLACEKLSPWLDVPMTREKLSVAFMDAAQRAEREEPSNAA